MKSKKSHAVLDIKSRKEKALAIIGILKDYKCIKNSKILDIGTGSGAIACEIGKISKNVYSVDIRDERVIKNNYIFRKIKSKYLPFRDKEFDIVVSNHVMAHVKNDDAHLKEISRVMKNNGIAYLSMLNRLWPFEPNFRLLFLSWLPKKLADAYVKIAGKGNHYDVNPLTHGDFIKKINRYFTYEDATIKAIKRKIPITNEIYGLVKIFSPVWIFLLKKRS